MADETVDLENATGAPKMPLPDINRTLIAPFNQAMAAGTREMLRLGITINAILEMQINHLASTVAQIEPPGARLAAIEDIVRQFSPLVRAHVDMKNTTAGGVIVPNGRGL